MPIPIAPKEIEGPEHLKTEPFLAKHEVVIFRSNWFSSALFRQKYFFYLVPNSYETAIIVRKLSLISCSESFEVKLPISRQKRSTDRIDPLRSSPDDCRTPALLDGCRKRSLARVHSKDRRGAGLAVFCEWRNFSRSWFAVWVVHILKLVNNYVDDSGFLIVWRLQGGPV